MANQNHQANEEQNTLSSRAESPLPAQVHSVECQADDIAKGYRFCEHCGTHVKSKKATVCWNCKTPISAQVEGLATPDIYCDQCVTTRRWVGGNDFRDTIKLCTRHAAFDALVEALILALPYVETALEDEGYKPGVVDRMTKTIRAALKLAEGK